MKNEYNKISINDMVIKDSREKKILRSSWYNYNFYKKDGLFLRWGKNINDDPLFGLPEIADIEISDICHGVNNTPCKFCYKSNTPAGHNMSFGTFSKIIDVLPNSITQVALGIGDIDANADLWEISAYCHEKGIIPNITINGDRLTDYLAGQLARYMGGISVSLYDKDITYNAVEKLCGLGHGQVNIHYMLSHETYPGAFELIEDVVHDKRLDNLHGVIFLSLKQMGRGKSFTPASQAEFERLIDFALGKGIRFGFDSCSAHKFLKSIETHPDKERMEKMVEPCESFGMFSLYVNNRGRYFPCSFAEKAHPDFMDGIDLLSISDFIEECWNSELIREWRNKMIKSNRVCPLYNI
ncbi:MAG: radical SAM/SPASM domain-containing protein [bacterium]